MNTTFTDVCKLLTIHIQKISWKNSLSIVWVKTLYNIMSLNQELLYFVQSIRYQGMDLTIDYEWARVNYFDVDTQVNHYKFKRLNHVKLENARMGPNWQMMRSVTYWNRVYLRMMPRIAAADQDKLYKIMKCEIRYGTPYFEFAINKSLVSQQFGKTNQYRAPIIPTQMMAFIYNSVKKEMENRVNISSVLSENAITYSGVSSYPISVEFKDITLKNYQKENVRWMNQLEAQIPYNMEYLKSHRFGHVWIDPYQETWSKEQPETDHFTVLGGALLDEMGLGKTIVAITGCLTNPPDPSIGTPDRYVYPQFKDGCPALIESKSSKNYGKKCNKKVKEPNETYCKTHRKKKDTSSKPPKKKQKKVTDDEVEVTNDDVLKPSEILIAIKRKADDESSILDNTKKLKDSNGNPVVIDKTTTTTPVERDNTLYPHYLQKIDDRKYIQSRATLVIAPNQLPQHWISQFKHIKSKSKILRITCLREYKLLSYRDVMNADFVITSFDFMGINKGFVPDDLIFNQTVDALSLTQPYFGNFYFHRVVVDEIHEILDDKFKNTRLPSLVSNMKSNYRWCLSGSAFTKSHKSYEMVVNYLCASSSQSRELFPYLQYKHHRELFRKCFRRNTAESTCWENLAIPPITYRDFWLEFSNTERAMYEARLLAKHSYTHDNTKNDMYLRQLCCHPQLSAETKELLQGCTSLKDINEEMKKKTMLLIENIEIEIEQTKESLKYYKKFLMNDCKEVKAAYEDDEENYLQMYRTNKGRLTRKTKQRMNLKKSLLQYKGTEATNANILESLEAVGEDDPDEEEGEEEDSDLNYLIQIYGTKMANLINYIKKDFDKDSDNRAIIFSQWDNLLKNVQITLKQNGIKSLVCKGSIFQKNKAILNFKKDSSDFKIILLSTKYAASGLDLMEANKIIFIDPIYGESEYRNGIEAQAIARAHRLGQKRIIEVIRFLMKGTIEEEIHFQKVKKADLRKIKII